MTHICDINGCHGVFHSPAGLTNHKIRRHNRPKGIPSPRTTAPKVICELCGILKPKDKIKAHLCSHNTPKLYKCIDCPSTYSQSWTLKRHIDSVHRQLRFVCDHCASSYTTKDSIRRHIQSEHLETRPFCCKVPGCCKTFPKRHMLKQHFEEAHTTKKFRRIPVLSCPVCEEPFRGRFKVRAHMAAVHLDERKYICEICFVSFGHCGSLWNHKAMVHPIGKRKHMDWSSHGLSINELKKQCIT